MPRLRSTDPGRVRVVLALALAAAVVMVPAMGRADSVDLDQGLKGRPARDPIVPLVRRMDRYFQRHEVDGVVMDWRYQVSPSEEIRQTVVCQLLGYAELYRLHPRPRLRRDIAERASFLIGRLEEIRSHTPFDGMLAYCLLAAYETTGEPRFLAAGAEVMAELLAIPTSECVLNGGLMVAMAAAEDWRLSGNAQSKQKALDILGQLGPYQNGDGSFPHWCFGSRDIHYTGWMSMELIHIQRMLDDPQIAPILGRTTTFLEGRIDAEGKGIYEEPCPDEPGCTLYYYSRASGCWFDYDTRGWTVEPAYCALLFDHMGSAKYRPVMQFLLSLEDGGTFPDLYGYWPPPDDPEYPWTIADTSVVNMSIIFWALTTAISDRANLVSMDDLQLDDEDTALAPAAPVTHPLAIEPNPARNGCALRLTLVAPAEVALDLYDAAGRRVCLLELGVLPPGTHTARWDGRDLAGREVPSGTYFARLRAGGQVDTRRFLVLH